MGWRKILDNMASNPKGDWRIENFETICQHLEEYGVSMRPPRRGTHYTVRHSKSGTILTIPTRRPVKAVYVKRFVDMIVSIIEAESDVEGGE